MTRLQLVSRHRIFKITRVWLLGAVAGGDQAPDRLQIPAHVVLHRRRAVGFELGLPVEADVGQRVDHCSEVDLAFAQVVRVVLQVDLADVRTTNQRISSTTSNPPFVELPTS